MEKPNILLITTDQQRFDTINALGNKYIFTPHLNWLVDQGVTYTRCYTSSPICMAARATIMTGKHGYTTGLTGNKANVKPMSCNDTLPGVLTRHGYQTRAQGKMHFEPMRANYGFEHMELPMDYYRERNRNAQLGLPKEHGVGENEIEPVISTVNETDSLTYWTVKRSIDFLETRDETRPFFLWTSFTKPHPPYDPCLNYWTLYQNKEMPESISGDWSDRLEDIPQGYMEPTYMLNNAYRLTENQMQDVKRAYYACISQIDYSLGLLFARMRELDLFENTWIIFTTDHGDMMGDHHMGAKSVFLEGSAHIPLIIRPPFSSWEKNSLSGKKIDTVVNLADIMPTVLNLAGIQIPGDMDGTDVISIINTPDYNRSLYGNCNDTFLMYLEGEYKYLWTALGGAELLFNLKEDPQERYNLAGEEKAAEKLEYMRKRLMEEVREKDSSMLKEGELACRKAPDGPQDISKWPGFHSTVFSTDVLH